VRGVHERQASSSDIRTKAVDCVLAILKAQPNAATAYRLFESLLHRFNDSDDKIRERMLASACDLFLLSENPDTICGTLLGDRSLYISASI